MWTKKARSRLLRFETNHEHTLVRGEHDGYTRLKDPVLHRREVLFDKREKHFEIKDKIFAKKGHLIEQFFHISKLCHVVHLSDHEWKIKNDKKEIIIKVDEKLDSKVLKGNDNPILGWESNRFDVKEKTYTLLNSLNSNGNCELKTSIFIR